MSPWCKKLKDHQVLTVLAEFKALPAADQLNLPDHSPSVAAYKRAIKVVERVRVLVLSADPELIPFTALDRVADCLDRIRRSLLMFSRTHDARAIEIANEASDEILKSLPLLHTGAPPMNGCLDDMSRGQPVTAAEKIERSPRLAYTVPEAAALIGRSARTVFRLIRVRKIYPTKSLRLITREELLRYLREETEASKPPKRFPSLKKRGGAVLEAAPAPLTSQAPLPVKSIGAA